MRKIAFLIAIVGCSFIMPAKSNAQSYEMEQLILDWEKLSQLKNILNDLYKGYEILSSGYNAIKDISQGNFNLHKAFLDGLLHVSPAIRNYKHIAHIIEFQSRLVTEYKAAYKTFKQSKHFTADEIIYLGQVYEKLFNESLNDIDNLINVISDSKLRMSDDERLNAIDQIYLESKNKLMFLRQFNSNTAVLAAQRSIDDSDAKTIQRLHGLDR